MYKIEFNKKILSWGDTSAGTWVPPLKKNVETWVIGFICILCLCTFLSWASRARYRPYGGRLWQIRVVVFLRLRAEGASSSRVHFCYSIIMNLHMISADIANHLPATDSPASYISRLSMTLWWVLICLLNFLLPFSPSFNSQNFIASLFPWFCRLRREITASLYYRFINLLNHKRMRIQIFVEMI